MKKEKNSALLVADENCQENFRFMPSVNDVKVIMLKCNTRQQIRPTLSHIVADMKSKPVHLVNIPRLNFLEDTLKQLREGGVLLPEKHLLNQAEQRSGMYFHPGSAVYLPQ